MTSQVRIAIGVLILVYSILLNIPINYHPMNLLPSIASSNISDLHTKPLPPTIHHRFVSLIGAAPTVDTLASATTPATTAAPTVTVVSIVPTSDSVPILHPNPVPYFVDTGASLPVAPSSSELLPVSQAPFRLIRSATSVAYSTKISKASSKATTLSNNPYTLITGEDTTTDLSSPDTVDFDSDLVEFASSIESFESFDIWEFGTATLVYISNSELTTILAEPTLDWTDWFDWIPLPRLTPTESCFHVFGLDDLQVFALFHLIPIWIYSLLHFGLE